MNEFYNATFANFLGTLLASIPIYFIIEKHISNLQKRFEKNKLLTNLVNELITDYIISERILTSSPITIPGNTFPVARYKYTHINNFYFIKPLEDHVAFYLKLNALMLNFENTNYLIDLIFASKESSVILANKKSVITFAQKHITSISSFLKELNTINNKLKFINEINIPKDINL